MADDVTSNILEWSSEFRELMDMFTFDLPGKDQSIGRDLAGLAAQAIIDRSISQQSDPKLVKWRENSEEWTEFKRKNHGVTDIGVLTGQMLSLESMMGDTSVGENEVTMIYGTGTQPTKYATYGEITGDEPTDREKASWFTEGGREFYELNETDAEAIYDEVAKALEDYLTGA